MTSLLGWVRSQITRSEHIIPAREIIYHRTLIVPISERHIKCCFIHPPTNRYGDNYIASLHVFCIGLVLDWVPIQFPLPHKILITFLLYLLYIDSGYSPSFPFSHRTFTSTLQLPYQEQIISQLSWQSPIWRCTGNKRIWCDCDCEEVFGNPSTTTLNPTSAFKYLEGHKIFSGLCTSDVLCSIYVGGGGWYSRLKIFGIHCIKYSRVWNNILL